jgi:hypothetical protein
MLGGAKFAKIRNPIRSAQGRRVRAKKTNWNRLKRAEIEIKNSLKQSAG